jgi:hypothetical protein
LASKFAKSANMTPKNFFCKKKKKISKTQNFHADFDSVEKVVKKCTKKKVTSKTSLTNISIVKVKKVHISVTFLLITFFGCIVSKGLEISVKFWFFDTHIEFFNKKIFFVLINTFCTL